LFAYYLYAFKYKELSGEELLLNSLFKKFSQVWWFAPIILAILESEICRIVVQDQPRKKFMRPPSNLTAGRSGAHLSSQLCMRLRSGGLQFSANPGKKVYKVPMSREKNLGMVIPLPLQ
jgi:hypothetical protein